MKSFKNTLLAGAVAIVSLAAAGSAQALTYTQNLTVWGPFTTEYVNDARGFAMFDTAAGTLNSVTLSATYGFNSTITVTNSAMNASSGNVRTESAAQFSGGTAAITNVLNTYFNTAGSVSFGLSATLSPVAFDLTGATANYSLDPNTTSQVVSNKSAVTYNPGALTDASVLSAFSSGPGATSTILLNTLTGTLISNNGGNTAAQQRTTATATFSIIYDYTAPPPPSTDVPEPASIALLGASLLGLGLIRRKA